MNLTPTCVTCIFSQSLRVCEKLQVDDKTTKKILDSVAGMIPEWSFDETPPQVAARVYPEIAKLLQTDDIYYDFKREATEHAKAFIPFVEEMIDKYNDKFYASLKAAVAGNVIDLAAMEQFDLQEEVAKVFDSPFEIDDSEELRKILQNSKNLLVVGDNAGEHLFDKVMMKCLKNLFPNLHIFYAVRGKPIINDITIDEAIEAGIDEVAEIIDSGVDTPGLDLNRASDKMLSVYKQADVVLAKGMGNYESLYGISTRPTFFLLKVKCSVVAASLGRNVGDIICYKESLHD
ncbi:ARMT1-like domain-containing protein [Hydrogenimonas thermophila]|uniref:damage-control phosphatase ARMT1 family protein n=1 Tax=Hydrogenimonas thermophila TaxID=223786 RepID=UPI002936E193|nr:ARMT1-like domain-containing protein [Hydrogenimonas thermophila]WOE69536.1 ARMT1-like domain-containing protein [Hydrogenimonas thermophila]WOE72050.1 ARMT1-like domain-containing protein [Hydrogenimonas thermophila]